MKLIEWITGSRQKRIDRPHYPQWGKKGVTLSPTDELASRLTLYGHNTCVFCREVNKVIDHLEIKLKIKNTFKHPEFKQELLHGGGKVTVPCLKIISQLGEEQWLYDSATINNYLLKSFPQQAKKTNH